jgi:hypothetical protein
MMEVRKPVGVQIKEKFNISIAVLILIQLLKE